MLKFLTVLAVAIALLSGVHPAEASLLFLAGPVINVQSDNLAANSINFPLAGSQYEYLPFDAYLEFAVIASAATVDVTVFSGSDVLQQGGPPIVKTPQTAVYPDDFTLTDTARRGERISVVLRETGGVATTDVHTVVKITPL